MNRRHQAHKPKATADTSSSGSGCLLFVVFGLISLIAGGYLIIDGATTPDHPKRDGATEAAQEAWRKAKWEEFEAATASVRELAALFSYPSEDARSSYLASLQVAQAPEHKAKLDECERIMKRYRETVTALKQTPPSIAQELKMIDHCRRMIEQGSRYKEHRLQTMSENTLPGAGRRITPTPVQESPATSSTALKP